MSSPEEFADKLGRMYMSQIGMDAPERPPFDPEEEGLTPTLMARALQMASARGRGKAEQAFEEVQEFDRRVEGEGAEESFAELFASMQGLTQPPQAQQPPQTASEGPSIEELKRRFQENKKRKMDEELAALRYGAVVSEGLGASVHGSIVPAAALPPGVIPQGSPVVGVDAKKLPPELVKKYGWEGYLR